MSKVILNTLMMDKKIILDCIKKADAAPAIPGNDVLTGFSGAKLIALLGNLASQFCDEENAYLEIGVYQGLSLLSVAMACPGTKAFGIDNFSFFDRDGKNLAIVNERMHRLGIKNAAIINEDYEDALEDLDSRTGNRKIGLCFIDGPHDYRSQLMCLLLIRKYLADEAVIVVDDSNYRHVRQANSDFLTTNPEFRLIFEAYTQAHPTNLGGSEKEEARMGWWNGVNVIIKDRKEMFSRLYPPTLRQRTLFENDHFLHTVQFPEAIKKYAPVVVRLAGLAGKRFSKELTGKYRSLNTYSDGLKKENYNPSFFD